MMLLSSCWCCPIVQFRDDDHCYTPFVQLQTCLKFLPVNGNTFNTPFEINTWIFKELLKKLVLSCCRGRSVRPCLPKSAERGAAIKVGSGGWSCRGREQGDEEEAPVEVVALAEPPQVGGGAARLRVAQVRSGGAAASGRRRWAT